MILMILLFFIMRCTPTIRELIVATPLSLSSPSATGLSALAPAQRAGAQRLCALAQVRSLDRIKQRQMMPSMISCTRATTMSNVDSGIASTGKPSSATV
jgi:hypothetical protein